MTNTKKTIRVVDVPVEATADQAEELLNTVCDDGYRFMQFRSSETGGIRAFFHLRAETKDKGEGIKNHDKN